MNATTTKASIAGKKIGTAFTLIAAAIDVAGVTIEDIDTMVDYARLMESAGPVLNPTAYRIAANENMMGRTIERCEVMRRIIMLKQRENL